MPEEAIPSRLQHAAAWDRPHVAEAVRRRVREGFRLDAAPERGEPRPRRLYFPAQDLPRQEDLQWIHQQLAAMTRSGAIRPATPREVAAWSPLFSIPKSTPGKRRLICDAREVNKMVPAAPPLEFPTIRRIRPQLRQGMWAAVVDIRSGYVHVKAHPEAQPWLGIQDPLTGQPLVYQTAPFGLAVSPYLFCTTLAQTLADPRLKEIRASAYIDDLLLLGETKEQVTRDLVTLLDVLDEYGWVAAPEKVQLPAQRVTYLGVDLDFEHGLLCVPPAKAAKIATLIEQMLAATTPPSKLQRASLAGKLGALAEAFPVVRALTASLFRSTRRPNRPLGQECRADLRRILQLLPMWKGAKMQPKALLTTLTTDASDMMMGASVEGGMMASWPIKKRMLPMPIHIKEAEAVRRALSRWGPTLQGQSIPLLCDNQAVVFALRVRRAKDPRLNRRVKEIALLLLQHGLHLDEVAYTRSEDNLLADRLSRGVPVKEAPFLPPLSEEEMTSLVAAAGSAPQLELFPRMRGRSYVPRCRSWVSRWPGGAGVGPSNSFSRAAFGQHTLVVPPLNLLDRTVRMLQEATQRPLCRSIQWTFVGPIHESSHWFKALTQELPPSLSVKRLPSFSSRTRSIPIAGWLITSRPSPGGASMQTRWSRSRTSPSCATSASGPTSSPSPSRKGGGWTTPSCW
ncbi:MAG: hypothetical protein Rubg2KO_41310 [Rubricoccaceae bacterium]